MKLRFLSLLALLGIFIALPAYALTLEQARTSGAVGEQLDGYVATLKGNPEVRSLVAEVNAKRQQEYARIAKEKGQPVDVVAKLAAQQIINNLAPGSMYQAPGNGWKAR